MGLFRILFPLLLGWLVFRLIRGVTSPRPAAGPSEQPRRPKRQGRLDPEGAVSASWSEVSEEEEKR